jgi:fumarylacetoacetate (FAA) hydrolase
MDYELEIGAVIKDDCINVERVPEAWDHVSGFVLVNDFSARDIQRRETAVGLGPAKGKDFATAIGPRFVPIDEVKDCIHGRELRLGMVARVNGRELSRGNCRDMYWSFPSLINYASQDCRLLKGDLLGSGTCGFGCIFEIGPENAGGWLKPGDVVEIEAERLGVLRSFIVEGRKP